MKKSKQTGILSLLVFSLCIFVSSVSHCEDSFIFAGYNEGAALGCVVDAETGQGISGAVVALEMASVTSEEMKKPVTTDANGCYRLTLPVGTAKSKVKAGKILKSSLFSLITNPKGVTEQSKVIYNSSANIRVVKEGYKSFKGFNKALFADPKPFEIYLDTVQLAPESVGYDSHLVGDAGQDSIVIETVDIPGYFVADVEYTAEVKLKIPSGLAPEFNIVINYADPQGELYTGDKYVQTLALAESNGGEHIYRGTVVAMNKRFPREFRIIATINSGNRQLATKWLPVVLVQQQDAEKHAAELFGQGVAKYDEGKFAEAESLLRQAVDEFGGYKYFYEYLGKALGAQEKYEEALAVYRDWLAFDPKNHNPNVESAKILAQMKKYNEAYEILSTVGKLDKKDKDALYNYLQPLQAIRNIEAGTAEDADFEKALDLLITISRDYDYAAALLDKAEANYPQNAFINYLHGNYLYANGEKEEALNKYERAVQLDGKNGDYITTLAGVYIENGECRAALNLLEPYTKESNLFMIHYYAGVCNVVNGNKDFATENFSTAVKYAFSKEYMDKKYRYVKSDIYDAYSGGSGRLVFYQGQTRRYFSGFEYDEAAAAFDYLVASDSLSMDQNEAVSRLQLGIALHDMGLYDLAVKEIEDALAADETLVQGYKYLCKCQETLGNSEEEAEARQAYLQRNPFDSSMAEKPGTVEPEVE